MSLNDDRVSIGASEEAVRRLELALGTADAAVERRDWPVVRVMALDVAMYAMRLACIASFNSGSIWQSQQTMLGQPKGDH
jgi:hypothetical protein